MSPRCAATATPSPTCSRRTSGNAPAIGERGQHASGAAKSPSAWTGCGQTCVAPAAKCSRRPRRIVSASPQRTIASMNRSLPPSASSSSEALAQPAVAVVRQRHVARQFLAPQRPRFRRIGLDRYLLLHREPLRWPKDRGGLSRMPWCQVIWDSAARFGSAQRQHLRPELRPRPAVRRRAQTC